MKVKEKVMKWRRGRYVAVDPQIERWRKYSKNKGVCANKRGEKDSDGAKSTLPICNIFE